jgi:SET domain-containing protein 6
MVNKKRGGVSSSGGNEPKGRAGSKTTTPAPAASRRRPRAPPPSFNEWLSSQRIWFNHALLDLRRSHADTASSPCAIYARKQVHEGDLLARIPKHATLSRHTSSCSALLERQKLGGGLALTVAVMCELLRGELSRWYGYLRTLPWQTGEQGVPALWVAQEEDNDDADAPTPAPTAAELALVGTEAQGLARVDARDVAHDYRTIVEPALVGTPSRRRAWLEAVGAGAGATSSSCLPSLALFRRAASLVSSRAFRVDAWHGDAMVAVADAFNHKASCVSLGEGYVVGELQEQQEQQEEEEERKNKRRRGDDEQPQPAQQRPTAAATIQSAAPPEAWRRWSLPLRLEIAIISDDEEEDEEGGDEDAADAAAAEFPGVLRIVAASDVPAGREVHNTYGELGNVDLVRKYGFCLRPPAANEGDGNGDEAAGQAPPQGLRRLGVHRVSNPFDRVRLSPQALIEGALALLVDGGGRRSNDDRAMAIGAAAAGGRGGVLAPRLTREELVERVAWLKSATDLLDAAVGEAASEEDEEEEEEEGEEEEGESGGDSDGESGSSSEEQEDEDDEDGDEDEEEPEQEEPDETPEQRTARFAADRAAAERLVSTVVASSPGSPQPSTTNPLPAQLLGDGAVAALPGAAVSRATFLLLHALTAPAQEFRSWASVSDALAPGERLAAECAAARRRRWCADGAAGSAPDDPLCEAFADEVPVGAGGQGGGGCWTPAMRAVLAFALARRLELYSSGGGTSSSLSSSWWAAALSLLPASDVRALEGEEQQDDSDDKGQLVAARGLRAAEQRLLLHTLCATVGV